MNVRGERMGPLSVAIGGSVIACVLLYVGAAPRLLFLLACVNLLQVLLFLSITSSWKISLHGASATGVAVLACALMGGTAIPFVLSVPLIGWSRIHLGRHTPGQVLAGAGLGGCSIGLLLVFFGVR
jgi:membrane-associated phospholipid phosphatase